MMSNKNVLFAVYRMDESEHGLQEFRLISLTDETGVIDADRLKDLDLASLRKTYLLWSELEKTMIKLAKVLGCDQFVCISLPEYNRLVGESTDLAMLQQGMKSFAKPLTATVQDDESTLLRDSLLATEALKEQKEEKKSWMDRIFS